MGIKAYFAEAGEQAFRDQETAALRQLLGQAGPCVLSTGGGAVLRPENRVLLKSAGAVVVYLHATPEALYKRLRHDTQRPLLQVADPKAKIQTLYDERDGLYRETAHHVIHCGNSSLSALVKKVVKLIEREDGLTKDQ